MTEASSQRSNDAIDERGAPVGAGEHRPSSAKLDAVDDPRGMTPVEVEQDGHHSKPGPPDILEGEFEIVKDEVVEPGGRSVGLDPQAGAAVAEHEPAQDLDAARTQQVQPLVERAVTATAGEAALQATTRWRRSPNRSAATAGWRQRRS